MQLRLIALLYFFSILQAETISITAPDFSNVIEYVSGIRPYRSSGIRLEPEYINGKLIIHNYGHGGSGLSLSWGSAHAALAILDRELPSTKPSVAILGSGVIGLSLAHTLLDRGYEVHLYAAKFPPDTTSDIATGTFAQFLVEQGQTLEEKARYEQIVEISLAKLDQLARGESPEFQGVSYEDFYNLCSTEAKHVGAKLVEVKLGNSETKTAEVYPKLFMEAPLYMNDLFEKMVQKGALVTQRAFLSVDELSELSEGVVFNCTGFGSRKLCQDFDLIPIRGQLVHVAASSSIPYILFLGNREKNTFCAITPKLSKNVYAVGGCLEMGEEENIANSEMCESLLKNARDAFLGEIEAQLNQIGE